MKSSELPYPGMRPRTAPASRYALFHAEMGASGFSPVECEKIIADGLGGSGVPATVARREASGTVQYSPVTDIRSATIFQLSFEPKSMWLYERIYELAEASNSRHWRFDLSGIFHPLKLIRYETGDHYTWHTDLGAGVVSDRKLSVTVQLSAAETYEGGDLEFLEGPRPMRAPRDRGTTIIFPSYLLHRVTPIERGVRFSLVTWIQGAPFR